MPAHVQEPGSRELAVHAPHSRDYTIRDIEVMAEHIGASGLFGMSKSPIMTLLLLADAEGLHPIQALRRYHIIEGKPSLRADAMQADFQRFGGRIKWVRSDAEVCEATFIHPVQQPDGIPVIVTMKELIDNGVATTFNQKLNKFVLKANYQKFPRQMLRARAIAEGVRMVLPEVCVGLYSPEEVADMGSQPSPRTIDVTPVDRSIDRPIASQSVSRTEPVKAQVELDTPPPPITAEQAERIHELIGQVGLTPYQYQAALAKRGVKTVEQLNGWDAAEIIRKLEAKIDADNFDWSTGKRPGESEVETQTEAQTDAQPGTQAKVSSDPADDFEIADQPRRPDPNGPLPGQMTLASMDATS